MSIDIFRDDALRGKSILVTGGGSGLGKEISKALVAKGAFVHICGRRPQVLESAAAEISAEDAHAVATHVCDIRDAEQVETMMSAIFERGPLTGLVNNAARQFHRSHQGPQPTRLPSHHLDRHGRQLSRHARGGQALDRRRPQGFRRQQSRDLGVDRLGLSSCLPRWRRRRCMR